MSESHQQIAILDFGSQYTHLIARRFRTLGVLAKIYPIDFNVKRIDNLIGIVLSGSPGSVSQERYPFKPQIFDLGLPILGLCYGHQLIAKHFGGQVNQSKTREYGLATLQVGNSVLFDGLAGGETVWMSQGDSVEEAPAGFKVIGASQSCPIAAMENVAKKIFSLQFHPEVTHTQKGQKILENFAFQICGAKAEWQIKDWQKEIIKEIKSQTASQPGVGQGSQKVFLLVSGGVDSTVCFALLEKALGPNRVYGLHVDTGLMRKDEAEQVKRSLKQAGFKNLHIKDASRHFLEKLKGVIDPEEKRKIIGQLFLDIQEEAARELNLNPEEWLLGQGTIYPDTIETGGTTHADTIKTHHNRVDRIQELIKEGRVIEPIKDLYKDEVREVGLSLGLAEKIIWRQPFPGPGLGIRVLCEDGKEEIAQQEQKRINQKLEEVFENIKITYSLSEDATIQVLPLKSVGVQGDERTYANPCVIEVSSIKSPNFKEAQNFRLRPLGYARGYGGQVKLKTKNLDWDKVEKFSPEITNKVKEVNRVLIKVDNYQVKVQEGKLMKATVTKERLDLLREIDAIVQEEVFKAKLERDIWQFPVVLIPFGVGAGETVVLRPVSSLEAMTARFYLLPTEVLEAIVSRIEALGQISFIFYDVTNKPPGTIEWE